MNPWINYHHLFYFKTIAEEGTISKAAEKLLVGQPTLSAQLAQFEELLGVKLFERRHRRLFLTEQGKIALDYAKNIFKLGSEMYEVLHDRLKPLRPKIHVGALDSIPKQIILQLTKAALRISPCQITLSEGKIDELLRELSAHRVDLVISDYLPIGTSSRELYHKLITRNRVSFYGVKKFRNLRKGFPKSISGQPMVLPTYDNKLRYDLDHWAKLNEIELNILAESQDISTKKLVAAAGLGIIAAAKHSIINYIEGEELFEIGAMQGVFEEIYLISAKRKIPNPISIKLIDTFTV